MQSNTQAPDRTIGERLAVLETQGVNSKEDRLRMQEELETVDKKVDSLNKKVDTIVEKFNKIEGRFGGAMWVLGTLVTAIAMFGDKVWNYLQKLGGG